MILVNIAYFAKKVSGSGVETPNFRQILTNGNDVITFTKNEQNLAWCQLEFHCNIKLHEITLHNINFDINVVSNQNFQVWKSLDGKVWETIEISNKNACLEKNIFKLKLDSEVNCKYIRFHLADKDLLMSQIKVFVDKSDNKNIYLFTGRKDGLGQRLLGLLEVMAVAYYYGFKFAFSWENNKEGNHFHDVKSVHSMFSDAFIDKHYLGNIESNAVKILYGDAYVTPTIESIIEDINYNVDYESLYNQIKFSDEIQSVLDYVKGNELPKDLIGIHMRAGDIVYGSFRRDSLFFDKVLQYPFILEIINRNEQNKNIILVGQDNVLMEYLKKEYNIGMAQDYYLEHFTSLQKIFFDIGLLIRCKMVYGANSAPVSLANKLSNNTLIDVHKSISNEEKMCVLKKWLLNDTVLHNIPKEQIAYACLTYLFYGFNVDDVNDLIAINNLAKKMDESYALYHILDIVLLYQQKKYIQAEEEALKYIEKYSTEKDLIKGYATLYLKKFPPKVAIENLRYLSYLENILTERDDLIFALVYVGIAYYYIGDIDKAKNYFTRFHNVSDKDRTPTMLLNFLRSNGL